MFSALSRASGHLGIKIGKFSNSPGYAEFNNLLILKLASIFAKIKNKQLTLWFADWH